MNNTEQVLDLIKSKGVTLVFGNGYNRRIREIKGDDAGDSVPPSWENLITKVNEKLKLGMQLEFSKEKNGYIGITNPELFTTISLAYDLNHGCTNHSILPVHKVVAGILKGTDKSSEVKEIQQVAKRLKYWDIPVITTNYDTQLERTLDLRQYRVDSCPRTSAYYPVGHYYSDKELSAEEIDKHFAIWHCNGVTDYVQSLRLDHCDYCNYTAWLKKCVPMYGGTTMCESILRNSWLWPFFNNTIIIVGLSLDPSEFVLRWLLIRRAIWKKESKGKEKTGYYLCGKDDGLSPGHRLFLESAGITVLEYESRAQIYNELFGI